MMIPDEKNKKGISNELLNLENKLFIVGENPQRESFDENSLSRNKLQNMFTFIFRGC